MKSYYIILNSLFYLLAMVTVTSCQPNATTYSIEVTNDSQLNRTSETIAISLEKLPQFSNESYASLNVMNKRNEEILSQLIDTNQDSIADLIIFQSDFAPAETQVFNLISKKNNAPKEPTDLRTFCRIVPERMDDFAWENDRVAFRVYGPRCQQLFEEGTPGGLISSGIDCWSKRVNYPIIDKWYKAHQNGKSYHQDHGEGLDAYHVGTTRGCGGTAIVQEEQYSLSKNFIDWKVIANGPIRNVFELRYAPIEVDGIMVTERKRITLDLGNHLYHCEVFYDAKKNIDIAAIGLALHQGKGKKTINKSEGWVAYWEPMAGSYIGTGIVADAAVLEKLVLNDDALSPDESLNNIWAHVQVKSNQFDYWAGFGWKKSGYFETADNWENYLKEEAIKKQKSLKIKITKK